MKILLLAIGLLISCFTMGQVTKKETDSSEERTKQKSTLPPEEEKKVDNAAPEPPSEGALPGLFDDEYPLESVNTTDDEKDIDPAILIEELPENPDLKKEEDDDEGLGTAGPPLRTTLPGRRGGGSRGGRSAASKNDGKKANTNPAKKIKSATKSIRLKQR